jgi:hypothetical protein
MMGSLAGFANLRLNAKYYLYSAVAKRLPGFVWYVGSRILLYEQEGIRKSHTSVGIVLESAMMILSGMLIYLGSMLFSQQDWLQGKLPWLLLAMVPVVVAILKPALMIRFLNAVLARFGRSPLSVQIGWRESTRWVAQYCANCTTLPGRSSLYPCLPCQT